MIDKTAFSWLPVTTMSDGSQLRLPLHVLKGAKPGPTLGLTALVHGDEALPSVAIIRHLLDAIDPAELSGTIMAVPVINAPGAGANSRNTPLDGMNLNAAFGDPPEDSTVMPVKTVSEKIAEVMKTHVLGHFDYHIDFHAGDDTMVVNMIEYADDPECYAMARAFNMPILLRDEWGASQLWGASAKAGAKVIVAEVGGGSVLYDEWFARGVNGTLNVLRHLKMLPGDVVPPPPQTIVDNTKGHHRNLVFLRAAEGGLVMPEPHVNARSSFAGAPIATRVLGRLLNKYDLTYRQTFESPFERTLMLAAVVAPSWRAMGDSLYLLADADIAEPAR